MFLVNVALLPAVRRLRRLVVSALPAADDSARADPGGRGGRRRVPPACRPRAAAPVLAVRRRRAGRCCSSARGARAQRVPAAALEARFARAGTFVGERLPANALVITSWQSGSVRFYSGRRDARLGRPRSRRGSIGRSCFARERGFEPFLLFERWEEPLFRAAVLPAARLAALDWPPMAEIGVAGAHLSAGRSRPLLRGQAVTTEYVR